MAKIYYQNDCNLSVLKDKTVAIIGYGSQGHAHALNLHESGVNVIVGLYNGSKSWAKAEAAGLKVMTAADAAKAADIIMIITIITQTKYLPAGDVRLLRSLQEKGLRKCWRAFLLLKSMA